MDDFGVMPVFMNTVENGTYEGGNVLMIMANKNSDKLDDVLEFMSFCASPEVYNAAFEGVPTVSIYKNQTTNIQTPMVVEARSVPACAPAQPRQRSSAIRRLIPQRPCRSWFSARSTWTAAWR